MDISFLESCSPGFHFGSQVPLSISRRQTEFV
jgi:hypothetical protein